MRRRAFFALPLLASLGKFARSDSPLIIADGNSLTNTDYSAGATSWVWYLAQMYPDWRIINVACAGKTTPHQAERAPIYVDRLYEPGAICVMWEVTNDLFFGASPEQAISNLRAYCLARRAVGFRVLTMTVLPRRAAGFEPLRTDANRLMRAQWREFADGLLDVAADVVGAAGQNEDTAYYLLDGTHLNNAGEQRVAAMVAGGLAVPAGTIPGAMPAAERTVYLPMVGH